MNSGLNAWFLAFLVFAVAVAALLGVSFAAKIAQASGQPVDAIPSRRLARRRARRGFAVAGTIGVFVCGFVVAHLMSGESAAPPNFATELRTAAGRPGTSPVLSSADLEAINKLPSSKQFELLMNRATDVRTRVDADGFRISWDGDSRFVSAFKRSLGFGAGVNSRPSDRAYAILHLIGAAMLMMVWLSWSQNTP